MLCVALVALLGGCSTLRIAYGAGPDLSYWWLDRYIDFNREQAPKAREAIAQWFAWNRQTQLPEYAALLARAGSEIQADTTPARVCVWQAELTTRARTAFERIAPQAADVMLTVTPEQVEHLARRYSKYNDDFRDEYLQPDPAQRARANLKRTVDRAEELYGRLDGAQVGSLTEWLSRSPFDADVWFEERQQRQQAVLQILHRLRADHATHEQALAALRAYADQFEHSRRAEYRRYAENLQQFNCTLAAWLQNSTTPAQRRRAAERLAGWEGDVRALATAAPDRTNRSGNAP